MAKPFRKNWGTAKIRETANHDAVPTKEHKDKIMSEVKSWNLISVGAVIDRYKINGSVARNIITELYKNNLINRVSGTSSNYYYTKIVALKNTSSIVTNTDTNNNVVL